MMTSRLLGLALAVLMTDACTLSREVRIISDPPGARVWLGRHEIGRTPLSVSLKATGPIQNHTFRPEYVTLRKDGFEETVRQVQYEWSRRNVVFSIPFVLGVPGFFLWAKLPTDLHVTLNPDAEASAD